MPLSSLKAFSREWEHWRVVEVAGETHALVDRDSLTHVFRGVWEGMNEIHFSEEVDIFEFLGRK